MEFVILKVLIGVNSESIGLVFSRIQVTYSQSHFTEESANKSQVSFLDDPQIQQFKKSCLTQAIAVNQKKRGRDVNVLSLLVYNFTILDTFFNYVS